MSSCTMSSSFFSIGSFCWAASDPTATSKEKSTAGPQKISLPTSFWRSRFFSGVGLVVLGVTVNWTLAPYYGRTHWCEADF